MPSDEEPTQFKTLLVEHWAEITTTCLLAVLGFLVSSFVSDFKQHSVTEQQELHELETRVRISEIEISRIAARQIAVVEKLSALNDANARQWDEIRKSRR